VSQLLSVVRTVGEGLVQAIGAAPGIGRPRWEELKKCLVATEAEQASIVVVAMLQRFADIRSPGGYLRALTTKAAAGAFSCGPMVMALIGRQSAAQRLLSGRLQERF